MDYTDVMIITQYKQIYPIVSQYSNDKFAYRNLEKGFISTYIDKSNN